MASDVKVTINLTNPVGKKGFGIPLILCGKAASDKAYTECSNLTEIIAAGYANTTETYKTAALLFMQDNAPEKVAVCSTNSTTAAWVAVADNYNKSWRQLVCVSIGETGESTVAEIMAAVELLDGKMYFAGLAVDDTTTYTVANIERTVLFYCTDENTTPYAHPEAALVGATAGKDAGSITYKNVVLKGITPQNLTDSAITAIHNKGGITFVTKAGKNVTSEGKTAGGEYIDVIDSEDYIIQQLEYKTQTTLIAMDKIPYDNNGIALLEAVAVDVMKDAYNNGIIATNDDGTAAYNVNYALREDCTDTDRAARKYVGGQFSFRLAGAIHTVEITGEIIV